MYGGKLSATFVMRRNIVRNARFRGAAKGSSGDEVTEPT